VAPQTGVETVLHTFTNGAEGGNPESTLILSGSTLYGAAFRGGSGLGVVFGVNIETGAETVIYTFTGGADGAYPTGGLVLSSGVLYGTA